MIKRNLVNKTVLLTEKITPFTILVVAYRVAQWSCLMPGSSKPRVIAPYVHMQSIFFARLNLGCSDSINCFSAIPFLTVVLLRLQSLHAHSLFPSVCLFGRYFITCLHQAYLSGSRSRLKPEGGYESLLSKVVPTS